MPVKTRKPQTISDLTLPQRNTLSWLKQCGQPATHTLVAHMQPQSSSLPPSAVKRHLEALERKGFAHLIDCPDTIRRWVPTDNATPSGKT